MKSYKVQSGAINYRRIKWLKHFLTFGVILFLILPIAQNVNKYIGVNLFTTTHPAQKSAENRTENVGCQIVHTKPQIQAKLKVPGDAVNSVSFSPNGQYVATTSWKNDNTAQIWDLSGKQLTILKGHKRELNVSTFSPDGSLIATASGDSTARIWDLSGKQLAVLQGHEAGVGVVAFSPDGKLILTGAADSTARIWDLSGTLLTTLSIDQGNGGKSLVTARFSPDGHSVMTFSFRDDFLRIWTLSGVQLAAIAIGTSPWDANFSLDGQQIVVATGKEASLWNLQGQKLSVFQKLPVFKERDDIREAIFDPSGHYVLTPSDNKTARLWNLSGRQLAVLKGHLESVSHAAFSPDGQCIITSSFDDTVRVWDLLGQQLAQVPGTFRLSISPDGKYIGTVDPSLSNPADSMSTDVAVIWRIKD